MPVFFYSTTRSHIQQDSNCPTQNARNDMKTGKCKIVHVTN